MNALLPYVVAALTIAQPAAEPPLVEPDAVSYQLSARQNI
jgi:hypothetical protein